MGGPNQVAYFDAATSVISSSNLIWDQVNKGLAIVGGGTDVTTLWGGSMVLSRFGSPELIFEQQDRQPDLKVMFIGSRAHASPANSTALVFGKYTDNFTPTEYMRIGNDGNVGIGTTAPGQILHVRKSSGATIVNAEVNANSIVGFQVSKTGATNQSWRIVDGQTVNGKLEFFDLTHSRSVMALDGATGNVGIGTTNPNFLFEVNGSAGKPGGGSWSTASDGRLKTNVRSLDGALDRLLQLRGVTFEYKNPSAIHELPGTQTGMVAQEVEQLFPQWVETSPDGYKRVTFRGFEALTVEALRGLRNEKDTDVAALEARLLAMIREQQTRITSLEAEIEALRAASAEAVLRSKVVKR